MNIYTKKHLLEKLQEVGLPATYRTLLKYEEKGIIPMPNRIGNNGARFYTATEMDEIVNKISQYKNEI